MMHWKSIKVVVVSMLTCLSSTLSAQETFETLKVGSTTYTNVKIVNRTPTDVYISHNGGFSNLKVDELELDLLSTLGYAEQPDQPAKPAISLAELQNDPRIQAVKKQFTDKMEGSVLKMDQTVVAGIIVAGFILYLFMCYCSMLICRHAGIEPGILVWIPVLQMFPMLKAAGMPVWWFLLFLLPVLNLLASIVWSIKIAQACGKSALVGILLLLPVAGFFAFLYLAFSSGSEEEQNLGPIKLNLNEG